MANFSDKLVADRINKVCRLFFYNIDLPKTPKKFRIKNRYYKIKCNETIFTSKSLLYIAINFYKIMRTYRYSDITVELDLLEVKRFADKNTYLILDLFIFYLLYNCPNIRLYISINISLNSIIHNGLITTALFRVSNDSKGMIERKKFIDTYLKAFIDLKYFRKIYTGDELNDMLASNVATNVDIILKPYFEENWRDQVVEALSEIICNACSHNKNTIILDIDICDQVESKLKEDENTYKALNVSILNIGENLLYDRIMDNVKNRKYKENDVVYKNVYLAYDNHKTLFDDSYNENDFFIITAFQKRVSSRSLESGPAGTGLTRLLQNITGKTEDNFSYVLSGKNGIIFKNEFLNVTKEGFVGFNYNNNYIRERPDRQVIIRCPIFIPGTIYQLHLVRRD